MSDHNTLTDDGIPQEFWNVPEDFIADENLRFLHADMCSRLRRENPDADGLELMAIERVVSLFFYMRYKESTGNMGTDTAYKGMMQMWVVMAADLRKTRLGSTDEITIRAEIMKGVVRAVNGALEGFEPDVVKTVKRRIVERLEPA